MYYYTKKITKSYTILVKSNGTYSSHLDPLECVDRMQVRRKLHRYTFKYSGTAARSIVRAHVGDLPTAQRCVFPVSFLVDLLLP